MNGDLAGFGGPVCRRGRALRGAGWLAAWLVALASGAWAIEWPQYRGPNGDGSSNDRILKQWPVGGPKRLWRKTLTNGFSSWAISGGRAYTLVTRTVGGQSQEVCIALDLDSGTELWSRAIGTARYTSGGGTGDGPRSTPTVNRDRVFVFSANLVLYSLNAQTGEIVWSRDFPAEYGSQVISWENAASPLIEGDLVLVNGNASSQRLMALRASDGSVAWKGQNDRMTHATPVAATIQGVRQVIFFAQSGLVSVAPDTGRVLWRYAFPYNTSTAASPVVAGNIVYCSAGYNVGAGAVRISKSGASLVATEIWREPGWLMNHWSTPVHHNGHIYGLFGHGEYDTAPLKCLDAATGEEKWSQDGFGQGGLVLVDGKLLVLTSVGELVMVEPTPDAYTELNRVQAVAGKCWNVPAVSNGRIYARSVKEAVCLDVSVPPPPPLRLDCPVRLAGQGFQICIRSTDGQPIDEVRLGRIQVQTATGLENGAPDWSPFSASFVLSDGVVMFEEPGGAGQRYFRVLEEP